MKKYEVPQFEFVILQVDDIITNSPPTNKDDGPWLSNSINI